jgi:hypothetical protein
MGGEYVETKAKGRTARAAFNRAKKEAYYEYGHGGYSGTIAEKPDFIEVEVPKGKDPEAFAEELNESSDPRVDDKWGPACCVKLGKDEWLFFGVASS